MTYRITSKHHARIIGLPRTEVNSIDSLPQEPVVHSDCVNFGERVVALRLALRPPIKSAAALARIVGISQPSMWAIETGKASPDDIRLSTFFRLCRALRTNPTYLYTGKGPSVRTQDPTVLAIITRLCELDQEDLSAFARLLQVDDPERADKRVVGQQHRRPKAQ